MVPFLAFQQIAVIVNWSLKIAYPGMGSGAGYIAPYYALSNFVAPVLVGLTLRIGEKSIINPRLLPAPKGKRLVRPIDIEDDRSSMEHTLVGHDTENKC